MAIIRTVQFHQVQLTQDDNVHKYTKQPVAYSTSSERLTVVFSLTQWEQNYSLDLAVDLSVAFDINDQYQSFIVDWWNSWFVCLELELV